MEYALKPGSPSRVEVKALLLNAVISAGYALDGYTNRAQSRSPRQPPFTTRPKTSSRGTWRRKIAFAI